jgi:membrane protease subunit (stomatin/prohibitin family)
MGDEGKLGEPNQATPQETSRVASRASRSRLAVLDVIEFLDPSGQVLAQRIPQQGSGEFRLGSQLVVQESQVAVFYKDGKALDGFTSGRYTLSTDNLPLLTSLVALPFGGKSPFRCYVYFLATHTFINLTWKTTGPKPFRDSTFGIANLTAEGVYSIRLRKPRVLLQTLVGTMGLTNTQSLLDYFGSVISSRFTGVLGEALANGSVIDLPSKYRELSERTALEVGPDLEKYGLHLVDFVLRDVSIPDAVRKPVDKAAGQKVQDLSRYGAIAAANALENLAAAPGGTPAASIIGTLVGVNAAGKIGEGLLGPKTTEAATAVPSSPVQSCPKCHNPIQPDWIACPICQQLLRKRCAKEGCSRLLDYQWSICPFCATKQA